MNYLFLQLDKKSFVALYYILLHIIHFTFKKEWVCFHDMSPLNKQHSVGHRKIMKCKSFSNNCLLVLHNFGCIVFRWQGAAYKVHIINMSTSET